MTNFNQNRTFAQVERTAAIAITRMTFFVSNTRNTLTKTKKT